MHFLCQEHYARCAPAFCLELQLTTPPWEANKKPSKRPIYFVIYTINSRIFCCFQRRHFCMCRKKTLVIIMLLTSLTISHSRNLRNTIKKFLRFKCKATFRWRVLVTVIFNPLFPVWVAKRLFNVFILISFLKSTGH